MVYYLGRLEIVRDLIGTFCIVNKFMLICKKDSWNDLIGTFCIVNIDLDWQYDTAVKDLIGTFCIVNYFYYRKL